MRLLVWLTCLVLAGCSRCGPSGHGGVTVPDASVPDAGTSAAAPAPPVRDAGTARAAVREEAPAEVPPEEVPEEEGGEALEEEGGAMGHKSYRAFLRTARDCFASSDPACVIELVDPDAHFPPAFDPEGEGGRRLVRGCLEHLVAQRYAKVLVRGVDGASGCVLEGPEWAVTALQVGTLEDFAGLPPGDTPSTAAQTLAGNDAGFRAFLARARACREAPSPACRATLLADPTAVVRPENPAPVAAAALAAQEGTPLARLLSACLRNVDGRDFLRIEVSGTRDETWCAFSRTARGWKLTAMGVVD